MTIKEVEQILGLPRATVRFYEKEGLIEPKRGENGYRDYSQMDKQWQRYLERILLTFKNKSTS